MLLLALTATTLVSCDDDSDIAMTLEGTWQGDMKVSTDYNYNGQHYHYQAFQPHTCPSGDQCLFFSRFSLCASLIVSSSPPNIQILPILIHAAVRAFTTA